MIHRFVLLLMCCTVQTFAQRPFAHEGAIPADTVIFSGWAISCTLQRGYQDLSNESLGYATVGDITSVLGAAKQNGVVSLGDGGSATLLFNGNIYNGPGADFAVFENGFAIAGDTTFLLELAFVEVSSDGNRFIRFPALSLADTMVQKDNFSGTDPRQVINLAGKYSYGYGTPFDLDQLKDSTGIDVNKISHIRIVDVVGSLSNQYARRDVAGHKINDPWPTPFPSSGFDLDAVGAIHLAQPNGINETGPIVKKLFPNPVKKGENLHLDFNSHEAFELVVTNLVGEVVFRQNIEKMQPGIDLSALDAGVYFLQAMNSVQKILVE